MKKVSLVAIVILLVLTFVLAGAAIAQGGVQYVCYYSGLPSVPQALVMRSVIFEPGSGLVYFERTINGGQSNPYNAITPVLVPITAQEDIYINRVFFGTFFAADSIWRMPFTDCVGGRIGDGRINDGPRELGASLAAYCADGGGIKVWEIDESAHGILGFTASASAIDDALGDAASSGLPTLVDTGLGNSLYASPHGELVVQGPDFREPSKTYSFAFPGNRCG